MSPNTPNTPNTPSDREPSDADRADEALIRRVMSVLPPERRGPEAVRLLLAAIANAPDESQRGRAHER